VPSGVPAAVTHRPVKYGANFAFHPGPSAFTRSLAAFPALHAAPHATPQAALGVPDPDPANHFAAARAESPFIAACAAHWALAQHAATLAAAALAAALGAPKIFRRISSRAISRRAILRTTNKLATASVPVTHAQITQARLVAISPSLAKPATIPPVMADIKYVAA